MFHAYHCLLVSLRVPLGGRAVDGNGSVRWRRCPRVGPGGGGAGPREASAASVEELFADFLHFARLGRFTAADGYARALLAHPDLSAVTVLEAAEADKESVNTLMILVKNSSIGERAAQVIALIQAGEFERRRDPERIRANIAKLTGAPQQEYMATRHLAESGEYAIPWMVQTLLESDDEGLRARVITALPQIGKPAVNPLVMALRMADEDVKQHILRSLGEIGYPQAVAVPDAVAHYAGDGRGGP